MQNWPILDQYYQLENMSNFSSIMGNFRSFSTRRTTSPLFQKSRTKWKMLPSRMRVTFAFHDNLTNTDGEGIGILFCFFMFRVFSRFVWRKLETAAVIKVYTTVFWRTDEDNNPFSNSPPIFFTRGWNFFPSAYRFVKLKPRPVRGN